MTTVTELKGNVKLSSDAGADLTMGGAGSGSITMNKPITIGYVPSEITTSSQIGYREQPAITWTTLVDTVIATSSILPIGNYIMTFNMTNLGTYIPNYVSFGGSGGVLANFRVPWVLSASSFNLVNGTYFFTLTTAGTISLINRAANTQTGGDSNWTIIRIS